MCSNNIKQLMKDALVQPAHAQPKHLFGIVSKVDFAATAVAAGVHSHFGWIKRFRVSSYRLPRI